MFETPLQIPKVKQWGPFPLIDEVARVANEVDLLVKQGNPKKPLLLLHTDGKGLKRLIQAIEDSLGKGAAIDAKETSPSDHVRVTTISAGAGLESQIVFLVGLHPLFEEEQSRRLSDEEREMLIHENSCKLYMAVTRAGQRPVLTYSGLGGEGVNYPVEFFFLPSPMGTIIHLQFVAEVTIFAHHACLC